MKPSYFGTSELKRLLKIYERENGERRFSYIQATEYFKKEKKMSWNEIQRNVRPIIKRIRLWDRRMASIKKAIEVLNIKEAK